MAMGTKKQFVTASPRQIPHVRLYEDGNLETRYELLNKLGEGSFGTVSRVKSKETDSFYAMKTILKKPGNKSKASSLDNEVKLLTEVNHSNLIQLHEVLESPQKLYLIVELCEGGELGGYIKKSGPLPEETVKQVMSKLIHALHYLHKMNIVHRDLKLENILLKNAPSSKTDEFDIRVTDFGLSSKQSITSTDSLFNDYCGTPLYMAPEILENKNYSALCDVWAMGVIMYYLISGRHPYVANDERRLLEVIRSQKLRFDSERFRNVSSEGLEFLQGMLVYDTVHRRTMGELTGHPWLTGRPGKEPAKDIITMMKEFQAENDQHQKLIDSNVTTLINNSVEDKKLSLTPNEQSQVSFSMGSSKRQELLPSDTNLLKNTSNAPNSRSVADKNKLNHRTVTRLASDVVKPLRRSTCDVTGSQTKLQTRAKQNDTVIDSKETGQSRQVFNSPSFFSSSTSLSKPRLTTVRLGRSQSNADIQTSSRYSTSRPSLYQRPVFNAPSDTNVSSQPSLLTSSSNGNGSTGLPSMPPTATTTALMMINRHC